LYHKVTDAYHRLLFKKIKNYFGLICRPDLEEH